MIPRLTSASDFFTLAKTYCERGDYQRVIDVLNKSVVLKKNWQCWNNLGWTLLNRNQYLKAIDTFQKSIDLKEDWDSYRGLGFAQLRLYKADKAIDAFNKSIAIHQNWMAYQGLGWALFNKNQFSLAIDALHKSLNLHKDWKSYYSLGWALNNTKEYQKAIHAHRKALELNTTYSNHEIDILYSALANVYNKSGNNLSSLRSWGVYFSHIKPICSIDPFLGNGGIYVKLYKQQLNQVKSICASIDCEFHPSCKINDISSLESWNYLLYLHIPKCGGTSFERPLNQVKKILIDMNNKSSNLIKSNQYLFTGNLESNTQVKALTKLISPNSCRKLKSIFLVPHGASWSALNEHISKSINKPPRIFTTVRDPKQRLLSDIKHLAIDGISETDLLKLIDDNYIRLNNCMYKYIFDYGLNGNKLNYSTKEQNLESKSINNIDFIDIADNVTISKIKSSFLSASLLPNIVQYSRLNDSKDRSDLRSYNLSSDAINHAFEKCIEKKFLERDESINYSLLKRKTLNRLVFPSFENESSLQIHPLTFVIFNNDKCFILPTDKFLEDPIKVIHNLNSSI